MRLATWNINGLKARLDYLRHWLRAVEPDVVGLQELKMTDEQFPHEAFRELGYEAECYGQKGWNGVAVLSRRPVRVVQRGLPGEEDLGSRLLTVELDGLSFTTIYLPNGKTVEHDDFGAKLHWLDSLGRYVRDRLDPAQPAVLVGDFNLVPEPIDSWNEELLRDGIFHTADERLRYRALLKWGFVDTFRVLNPEEPGFTWWDYRAGAFHKKQGLRIDLVLATTPLMERATGATAAREWRKKVEGLTPSDHAPVWLDVEP